MFCKGKITRGTGTVPDAAACETAEQTLRMLGLPVTSGRAQKKEDKK